MGIVAHAAMRQLVLHPVGAVSFLSEQLKPATLDRVGAEARRGPRPDRVLPRRPEADSPAGGASEIQLVRNGDLGVGSRVPLDVFGTD